jgi:hypothetical protein
MTIAIVSLMQLRGKTILVEIVFFIDERYVGARLAGGALANGSY